MPEKEEINRFLGNFKKSINKHSLHVLKRDKNIKTIVELGFKLLDVSDEILRLTYMDYIDGPKTDYDDNYPGVLWEFGKNIKYEDIYIKLKLSDDKPVCISFHVAEKKLAYPFKDRITENEKKMPNLRKRRQN